MAEKCKMCDNLKAEIAHLSHVSAYLQRENEFLLARALAAEAERDALKAKFDNLRDVAREASSKPWAGLVPSGPDSDVELHPLLGGDA